jgi:hypothetical protein
VGEFAVGLRYEEQPAAFAAGIGVVGVCEPFSASVDPARRSGRARAYRAEQDPINAVLRARLASATVRW